MMIEKNREMVKQNRNVSPIAIKIIPTCGEAGYGMLVRVKNIGKRRRREGEGDGRSKSEIRVVRHGFELNHRSPLDRLHRHQVRLRVHPLQPDLRGRAVRRRRDGAPLVVLLVVQPARLLHQARLLVFVRQLLRHRHRRWDLLLLLQLRLLLLLLLHRGLLCGLLLRRDGRGAHLRDDGVRLLRVVRLGAHHRTVPEEDERDRDQAEREEAEEGDCGETGVSLYR